MSLALPAWYRSVVLQDIPRSRYSPHGTQNPNGPGRPSRFVSRRPASLSSRPGANCASFFFVGITCFSTVGMFSAVSNLGAGGTQDTALSDISNGVLYGTFALTGLVSGGINNRACLL